jgi:hypothetical protein
MIKDKSQAHEKTAMIYRDRYPKKSKITNTYPHGKNIWYKHYVCSTCGQIRNLLANTGAKSPTCDGIVRETASERAWRLYREV